MMAAGAGWGHPVVEFRPAAHLIQPKVRDGQKWRFKQVTIDNAWAQGDPEILNALATH